MVVRRRVIEVATEINFLVIFITHNQTWAAYSSAELGEQGDYYMAV